jgi:hypothetical protein
MVTRPTTNRMAMSTGFIRNPCRNDDDIGS